MILYPLLDIDHLARGGGIMIRSERMKGIKKIISPHKFFITRDLEKFTDYLYNMGLLQENIIVADIGGGKSPYQELFDRFKATYISIDILKTPRTSIIGNAQHLPLKNGVDIVLLIEVAEHLPNPKITLQEINRVLKKRGYLIITTPLIIGIHDNVDYFRYTDRALEMLLAEAGFEIIKKNPRGGIFSVLSSVFFYIPMEVSGSRICRFFLYIFVIPLVICFKIIDSCHLDMANNWTLGYDILAIKKD